MLPVKTAKGSATKTYTHTHTHTDTYTHTYRSRLALSPQQLHLHMFEASSHQTAARTGFSCISNYRLRSSDVQPPSSGTGFYTHYRPQSLRIGAESRTNERPVLVCLFMFLGSDGNLYFDTDRSIAIDGRPSFEESGVALRVRWRNRAMARAGRDSVGW